ncbi:MAG: aspartate aminotransferase family protein [Saprospiraceae bacterium]
MIQSHRASFLQHLGQTSPFPLMLEVVDARGIFLYGPNGEQWMDLISGIGVNALGHADPDIVKAVQEQAARFMHTMVYGEYVLAPQVLLAELLAKHLPESLNCTYLLGTGTEATEMAMKLAKRYTGRRQFIAAENAYHGSTQGAASLMSPTTFTQAYRPLLPGIHHIRFNNLTDLDKITKDIAAVIIETVQGEAGVIVPHANYLQALRAKCAETGTLLILDEIQAGFGRTGNLFAFEKYGIVPDILLLGKAFGGGMPLSAVVSSREIMITLSDQPILGHITTTGGHPVSCAASVAAFNKLISENLIAQVAEKEALFRQLLIHPAIRDLRPAGLWFAIELASFDQVQKVVAHCLANGVIIDWFLFNDRSLRLAPPLIITEEQIRVACAVILGGLDNLSQASINC